MSLINCEINLIFTWSEKCVLSNDTKATTFAITDTKLYVPVVVPIKSINTSAKPIFRFLNWSKFSRSK